MAIGDRYPILSASKQAYIFFDRVQIAEAKQAQYLPIKTEEQYRKFVVEPLLEHAQEYQKTTEIYTSPLPLTQNYITLDHLGKAETTLSQGVKTVLSPKEIAEQQLWLVLSAEDYTAQEALKFFSNMNTLTSVVLTNITAEDRRQMMSGQLQAALNISAPGMWTMASKDLAKNYQVSQHFDFQYIPNPDKSRMATPVSAIDDYEGIHMPVGWPGGFNVAQGGHIVTFTDKFEAIKQQYEEGKDFLFVDPMEGLKSNVDIYGTYPYFVDRNYKLVNKPQ